MRPLGVLTGAGKTFGMTVAADINGNGIKEIGADNHNALDSEQRVDFPPGFLAIYRPQQ